MTVDPTSTIPYAEATPADPPPLSRGDRNQNPPGMGLIALIREDLRTHDGGWFEPGFWAIALHRFGNWRMGIRPKLLRAPFSLLYRFTSAWAQLIGGVHLPYTVKVGRRVRIWHHGAMVLHARSIGDDVHIRHSTTFGVADRQHLRAIPIIGDRVDIGCGVCILGNVRVGDDSVIGANAVVVSDIPPGSTAVGIPARVIRRKAPEPRES